MAKFKGKATVKWHGEIVRRSLQLNVQQRLLVVGTLLRGQVAQNISIPVVKQSGARGRLVVTERSKPGEFPRAETRDLSKGIFLEELPSEVRIGTLFDYGVILELKMDRSFLVRTLNEKTVDIIKIMTAPMKLRGGKAA